ncbi:integrase [Actimicrobium sp. GrIS 1.19]|uniref:tyrosine-type recombinase/integrase n=1 Tax=Actimicrobium sp. GrIS 1.19 TaxID=3071708 RepID=UPI002E05D722|nr:integrase [Actimicrobium sp. GrIS 1.19]
MAKVKFTAGRVTDFQCEQGKRQSFLWDTAAPGLGLRATVTFDSKEKDRSRGKSYIFQAKLNGQAMRITIGAPATWTIDQAQAEARRLKVIIDNGQDPRQVKADGLEAKQAARNAKQAERNAMQTLQVRESVTLGDLWPEYVADRAPQWSDLHHKDHLRIIQAGGVQRTRSPKLTEPGPLASLAGVRLVDLTMERIEAWAKLEAKKRPTRARLALRLLKACLFWCAAHPVYAGISKANAAQSKKARESLGKSKVKNDVLQREQVAAWFAVVRQIANPVISAYLQCLLLTGARREELATLKWEDIDFQWNSLKLNDKVEDFRMVPMTPYVAHLLAALPRRSEWAFSSPTAASGRLTEPSIAHRKACAVAGLDVSLHGLRRSFASLCEWTETPAGIAAQIQGHAPQGVREQNYIRRPLDLLRMWHVKIEAWILEQAGVSFMPMEPGLRAVK